MMDILTGLVGMALFLLCIPSFLFFFMVPVMVWIPCWFSAKAREDYADGEIGFISVVWGVSTVILLIGWHFLLTQKG